MKFGVRTEKAESHAYEAGQVIKCLITKIQKSGRQHFENGYTSVSESYTCQLTAIHYTGI